MHPDDLNKVKDQLSTQENSSNNTNGRILDLKTGTVKKEGHPSKSTIIIVSELWLFNEIMLIYELLFRFISFLGVNFLQLDIIILFDYSFLVIKWQYSFF